jgi:hypothetical protein
MGFMREIREQGMAQLSRRMAFAKDSDICHVDGSGAISL